MYVQVAVILLKRSDEEIRIIFIALCVMNHIQPLNYIIQFDIKIRFTFKTNPYMEPCDTAETDPKNLKLTVIRLIRYTIGLFISAVQESIISQAY